MDRMGCLIQNTADVAQLRTQGLVGEAFLAHMKQRKVKLDELCKLKSGRHDVMLPVSSL